MADEIRRRLSVSLPQIRSLKDRRIGRYQSKHQRPRWALHMQATFWRVLMSFGMMLHKIAPPRPPKPDFARDIPSTVSGRPGVVTLHFYVPKEYEAQKRLWINRGRDNHGNEDHEASTSSRGQTLLREMGHQLRRRSLTSRRWGRYPVVVNFHGGGFTLGSALDDARWCGTVVNELNAVVVSVDYRRAPEHPFPTAVEDGVDAVLWLHKHAGEVGIDVDKIALSGFSSGANMAFTVPLRLYDHLTNFALHQDDDSVPEFHSSGPISSTTNLIHNQSPPATGVSAVSPGSGHGVKSPATVSESSLPSLGIKIACIVPWYPSLDYTRTREERRATCSRTDQELPALFTDLFDDSYLHPPKDVSLDSPYLSPAVAPTALLRAALPDEIIMHTCEWDMLLDEGEEFHQRLIKPVGARRHGNAADRAFDEDDGIGKNVHYKMVPGVPHGWDKAPNPLKPTPGVREHYLWACRQMRQVLGVTDMPERQTTEGLSAAPRGSIQIVR